MKIYLYVDESGSIHKNSNTRYFAVGGYFTLVEDKNKIISKFKKINLKIKRKKNLDLSTEIKSYDYTDDEKLEIFNNIQDIASFTGCVKVFDKSRMNKKIENSNLFYNYAVLILIKDCVLPVIEQKGSIKEIEFIINADSRNTSVGDLKDLEKYLTTSFILNDYTFKVTYYDSATNFGIQLADLIVNTYYNKNKNIKIVKNIINDLKDKNFIVSNFPKKR